MNPGFFFFFFPAVTLIYKDAGKKNHKNQLINLSFHKMKAQGDHQEKLAALQNRAWDSEERPEFEL